LLLHSTCVVFCFKFFLYFRILSIAFLIKFIFFFAVLIYCYYYYYYYKLFFSELSSSQHAYSVEILLK
jgi:hypothetical protein